MTDIQELKKKHFNIKTVIRGLIRKGKDPTSKIKEYNDIVSQLKQKGVEINDKSEWLPGHKNIVEKTPEIIELRRQHFNIKTTIREWVSRGKDPTPKIKEYNDIVSQLKQKGVEINDWTIDAIISNIKPNSIPKNDDQFNSIQLVQQEQQAVISQENEEITNDYRLTIAWTNNQSHPINNVVKIIEDYLIENDAKYIDCEDTTFDYTIEHIKNYNWSGDEKCFNLIKKSANYILDACSTDKYEKFNTSVFGSKR